MSNDGMLATTSADPYHLELTDAECGEVRTLAEEMGRTSPAAPDDLAWVAQARRLSCRLPLRMREEIRRFRHDPGAAGALSLANLPVDEGALPATPGVRDSSERAATVPAAAAMLIGLQLGEVIAWQDEKFGALVQNIVPVRGMEETQGNAGSVPLEFHTENAFHPNRPDYVGLICLRSDHAKEAGTLVASIREGLALINEADREVLYEPRFVTAPPPSFRFGQAATHPVLDGDPEDPNIRVDFNATSPLDDTAKHVLERLRDTMNTVAKSLVLGPGQMVFVDNRVIVHGRTHFQPRFDGRDRWLHRVYVHLDNRRSRVHRVDNGAVLT